MLSQETFLPWIILSLGIHITALTLWPLPPSWEATRPGPIAVDLRYSTQPGGNNQPNKTPGPGTHGPKAIMPPKVLHPHPKPAPPHKSSRPITPPAPIKKAAPHRTPRKSQSQKSAPAAISAPEQQPEKSLEPPSDQPESDLADTSMENLNGAASATDDTNASHASLSPASGTGTDNTGYGSGENSGTNGGGGGDGIIRATPLGYGENPPMPYPRSARRRGWEGEVLLKVDVSAHGRVLAVHIEQSSGYGILDDTALGAVSEWRFRPARVNGSTRPDTVIVPIHFRLDAP